MFVDILFYTVGSQSGWNRPLGVDVEEQGGDRGAKQHKGGENTQSLPLIVKPLVDSYSR